MLIILSPAKTMDMKTLGDTYPFTWPLFQQDADLLVGKMQQYGVEELQKLLKVSKSLAEENYNRYQKFDQADTPMKQALFAYNGSVFKTMQTEWPISATFRTTCGLFLCCMVYSARWI